MPLEELAIVFQEINKQLNSSNGYLGAISDRSKILYFNKQTVGEYLMSLLENDSNCSLKNRIFYRQDYLDEFNQIWETQALFHKELTRDLKKEIRDVTIFYQRRLKSQKGLISYCEFESSEKEVILKNGSKKTVLTGLKVIPRSSPLFQEFKIWQQLNNIEVFLSGGSKKYPKNMPALFYKDNVGKMMIEGKRYLLQEEKRVVGMRTFY